MSFELFVDKWSGGEPVGFSPGILDRVFGPFVARREGTVWVLGFLDGSTCELYVRASGFMVSRPTTAPELYEAIVAILREEGAVAYWPDGPLIAAVPDRAAQLPTDMVDTLGEPVIVGDGPAILEAIQAS